MHFAIAHKFGTATAAKARVEAALADAKTKLAGQGSIDKEEWSGDTLTFAVSGQGQQITGTLEVTDTQFIADATLPLMLRMFEGKIQSMIEQKAGEFLE
jgi:hypothetical protein